MQQERSVLFSWVTASLHDVDKRPVNAELGAVSGPYGLIGGRVKRLHTPLPA